MPEVLNLKFSGLFTSGNYYSAAPEGALEIADNVVIRNPDLVEPRRGYTATAVNPSGTMTRSFAANGKIYCFAANGDLRTYTTGTGWSSAFTDSTVSNHFSAPDATNPIRLAVSNKSVFFTTSSGVKCSDSPSSGVVALAGLSPVPYLSLVTSTGTNGPLPSLSSVAYYTVLCYYDANNNLVQSAPSNRFVYTNPNPGGAALDTAGAAHPGFNSFNTSSVVSFDVGSGPGVSVGDAIQVSIGLNDPNQPWFNDGVYYVTAVSSDGFGGYNISYQTPYVANANDTVAVGTSTAYPAGAVAVTVSAQLPVTGSSRATFAQLYRSNSAAAGVVPSDECFLVQEHTITSSERSAGVFTFNADITPDNYATIPLYTNALTGDGLAVANDLPPMARDLVHYNGRLLYANTQDHHSVDLQLIGTSGLTSGTSTVIINGVTYKAASSENAAATPPQFQLYTTGTPGQNIENTARSFCRVVTKYNYANSGAVTADYISTANDQPGLMIIREAGYGGNAFTIHAGQDGQTCWMPDMSLAANVQTSDNSRRANRIYYSNDGEPWGVPAENWLEAGAADQDILRTILVRATVFIFKKDGLYTLQGDTPDNYDLRPFDPGLVLLAPETAAVVNNQIFCLTNRGAVYISESGVSPSVSAPIERDFLFIVNNFTQYPTSAFALPYEDEHLFLLGLPTSLSDTGCSQQYVFNANPAGWSRWTIANAVHGCYDPVAHALVWVVGSKLWQERKSIISSDFQNPDGSAITCVVRPVPIACGDPLYQKLFRTLFLSFRQGDFTTCTVQFDSDGVGTGTPVSKAGPGNNGFGGMPYGNIPFGISSRSFIMRLDMPQAVGLCTTLSCELTIAQAQSYWQLQGMSVLFEPSTNIPRRG